MMKLTLENEENVINIGSVLTNPIKLKILKFLKNKEPLSLSEIHKLSKDITEIKHRETTYKYLEAIYESGLLEKLPIDEIHFKYKIKYESILIEI